MTQSTDMASDESPQETHPLIAVLLALVLLVAGLGTISLTGWVFISNERFVEKAQTASGVIVEMVDDGDDTAYPIVEYTAPSGEVVRFKNNMSGGFVGETVTVHFDPANPHDARTEQRFWRGVLVVIGAVLGAIMLVFGALLLIWVLHWRHQERWRGDGAS